MAEGEALRPLRLDGGLAGAVRATLGGWWHEIFVLTGLNLLWVIAAFSILLLPPATAAMFYVARQVLLGDLFIGGRTFWQPLRRYWRAAWAWGLAVVAVAGIAGTNLWLYRGVPGTLWVALRWAWATILVLWLALNLFFWPLWFAQDDAHRTLRTTWRNSLAFLSRNPLPALAVTLVTLVLGAVSVATGVLLGIAFMVVTALLATATLAAYLPREGAAR